tara:strand:+ start:734 stop:1627 length:894 start_codon:yes stop_codon:yes gene_type:complete
MENNNGTKMLFFRTEVDEASVNGIDKQLCIPAKNLVSMAPASNSLIKLQFLSVKNNPGTHPDQLLYDKVVLNVVQGDLNEVMDAIVQKINSSPHNNGFLVIADDCVLTDSSVTALNDQPLSAEYVHPSITSCGAITVSEKLFRTDLPAIGTGGAAPTVAAAGTLLVNTHYTNAVTAAAAFVIPDPAGGKAGDFITVTYIGDIADGNLHSYTASSDTSFQLGSMIRVMPHNATRIGFVDVSITGDNVVKITGKTDGDGGIGTTLRFVNKTGDTDGWAVDVVVLGQRTCNVASANTVFA